MATGRPKTELTLNDDERAQLASLARSRALPHAIVARAKVVLWSAEGSSNTEIAERLQRLLQLVGHRIRGHFDGVLAAVGHEPEPGPHVQTQLALAAADEAIKLAPEEIWLYTNRAHALMLLGRTAEARTVYFTHRGETKVQGEKSWEAVVLEDFTALRKAGLTRGLMDEIETEFAAGG